MTGSADLRLVFMGTPDFAVPALQSIIDAGYNVVAVYTRPPSPKGRGQQIQKTPVHNLADAHHIPVYTPASLRKSPAAQAEFAALRPDIAVVAAYGLILPQGVLAAPRYGCLNIHASLLPRWRGASPIHHAIWRGDARTGVTIMQMDEGLDTGPMIVSDTLDLDDQITTPVLQERLSVMGARLMRSVLADIAAGKNPVAIPQPEARVTHAPMLAKQDGKIDWARTAREIACQIRGLTPWPGTFATMATGAVIKILSGQVIADQTDSLPGTLMNRDGDIACGQGTVLRVTQIQNENGKRMSMSDLINGGGAKIGDCWA